MRSENTAFERASKLATPELTGFVEFLAAVKRLGVVVAAVAGFHIYRGDLLTVIAHFRVVVSAVAFQNSLVIVKLLNQGKNTPSC